MFLMRNQKNFTRMETFLYLVEAPNGNIELFWRGDRDGILRLLPIKGIIEDGIYTLTEAIAYQDYLGQVVITAMNEKFTYLREDGQWKTEIS